MQKSPSVHNITNIISVADDNQMKFFCLKRRVPTSLVFQMKDFFNLVLFSAVIHKRGEKKLVSKTIKYKLDNSSKMQFAKGVQIFFGKLSILSKIGNDATSRGVHVFCYVIDM